jgi:hypothetical protein
LSWRDVAFEVHQNHVGLGQVFIRFPNLEQHSVRH